MTAATTLTERFRLGYRPSLDGVRGLAIAMVLISHLALGGSVGGLAGVTLFFVLSGYLITALLLAERRDTGKVSLLNFYRRRLRRLVPALVATVGVVTVVQVVAGSSNAFVAAVGALSYMANWLLIAGADLEPLSHTWSLAVEEHFYLAWPALLIFLIGRRGLLAGLIAAAALSFGIRAWLVIDGASLQRIAFGTDARADALLIGCALAIAIDRTPRVALRFAVPALIAASLIANYTPVGLTIGLLAVAAAGAVLIRHAAEEESWLGWPPLARLGRISYGVYLFHFPLWHAAGDLAHPWRAGLVLIGSVLLAEASYRWIETPFQRGSWLPLGGSRSRVDSSAQGG